MYPTSDTITEFCPTCRTNRKMDRYESQLAYYSFVLVCHTCEDQFDITA